MKLPHTAVSVAGALYIALAVLLIPDQVYRHGFDKGTPVQLTVLLVTAAIFSIYIAIKPERFRFSRLALYGAAALIGTQIISVAISGNLLGALIGDTGRFVGSLSTFALIVVAIFNTQFKIDAFTVLVRFYIVAVELVVFIGIAQRFNLIELPGDQGMTSTLGNVDFFAAIVGTSLPLLLFLFLRSSFKERILLGAVAAVNLLALYWAGPLQA